MLWLAIGGLLIAASLIFMFGTRWVDEHAEAVDSGTDVHD